jgi:hypothetical protein
MPYLHAMDELKGLSKGSLLEYGHGKERREKSYELESSHSWKPATRVSSWGVQPSPSASSAPLLVGDAAWVVIRGGKSRNGRRKNKNDELDIVAACCFSTLSWN